MIESLCILALLVGLFAWKRRRSDAHVEAVLDRVLKKDTEALNRRTSGDPLDFRTSEYLRPGPSTGWGLSRRKVKIVRTIRAAIDNGYRVRLRAYLRGRRGRVFVRSTEVELRRR